MSVQRFRKLSMDFGNRKQIPNISLVGSKKDEKNIKKNKKDAAWGSAIEELPEEEEEEEEDLPLPETEKDTRVEIKRISDLLSTVDSDWGLRVKAMLRLEEMVRFIKLPFDSSTKQDLQSWSDELSRMEEPFRVQIHELRSSIVREVCRLLICLCTVLKNDLIGTIAALLPDLSDNFAVKKKVIAENSILCASSLIKTAPSTTYAPIFFHGLENTRFQVRANFVKFLANTLIATKNDDSWTNDESALLTQVESTIQKSADDKSTEVRSASKLLYKNYTKIWPGRSAKMSLTSHAKKVLLSSPKNKLKSPKGAKRKKRIPLKKRMMMEQKQKELEKQKNNDQQKGTDLV